MGAASCRVVDATAVVFDMRLVRKTDRRASKRSPAGAFAVGFDSFALSTTSLRVLVDRCEIVFTWAFMP